MNAARAIMPRGGGTQDSRRSLRWALRSLKNANRYEAALARLEKKTAKRMARSDAKIAQLQERLKTSEDEVAEMRRKHLTQQVKTQQLCTAVQNYATAMTALVDASDAVTVAVQEEAAQREAQREAVMKLEAAYGTLGALQSSGCRTKRKPQRDSERSEQAPDSAPDKHACMRGDRDDETEEEEEEEEEDDPDE